MSLLARPSRLAITCGLLGLMPLAPAEASQTAAAACAAKLAPEALTIYQATAPHVTPAADLRALVTSTTRSLATSGRIARAQARPSAIAAYRCLKQLQ
jgi:hypothetical protein